MCEAGGVWSVRRGEDLRPVGEGGTPGPSSGGRGSWRSRLATKPGVLPIGPQNCRWTLFSHLLRSPRVPLSSSAPGDHALS